MPNTYIQDFQKIGKKEKQILKVLETAPMEPKVLYKIFSNDKYYLEKKLNHLIDRKKIVFEDGKYKKIKNKLFTFENRTRAMDFYNYLIENNIFPFQDQLAIKSQVNFKIYLENKIDIKNSENFLLFESCQNCLKNSLIDLKKKIEYWSNFYYSIKYKSGFIILITGKGQAVNFKKNDINSLEFNKLILLCEVINIFRIGIIKIQLELIALLSFNQRGFMTKEKKKKAVKKPVAVKLPNSPARTPENVTIEDLLDLGPKLELFLEVSNISKIFQDISDKEDQNRFDIFIKPAGAIFSSRENLEAFLEITKYLFDGLEVQKLKGSDLMEAINYTLEFLREVDLFRFFSRAGISLTRLTGV